MTTTPPGWYDDGHGVMRWWDGDQWTEHVAVPEAQVADAPEPEVPAVADMAPTVPIAPAAIPELDAYPTTAFPTADPAPASAPTSKLWIVWVVLGVVVLATLIGTAVLIAQLVGAAARAGQAGGVTPGDANGQAAVAAVELYDDAWQNADCDAYFASTTENFRTQAGLPDCGAFESEAESFDAAVEDYLVTVTDVQAEGDDILVSTTETYTYLLDESGEPLDEPAEESVDWVYHVISAGDGWVIDDAQ